MLETADIDRMLAEAKQVKNLSEVHIVSALHPDRPFDYYVQVIRQVNGAATGGCQSIYTPVEIVNFAKMTGKSIREILR